MSKAPDFIFIGPGRSGTTFIYHYLKRHPEVCLAKDVKEINYFNDLYDRKDREWYLNFFRYRKQGQISGEISNMYFYDPKVAGRIKEAFPDVKIFTVLRNPYERIISAYQYRLSVGEIFDIGIDEALIKYPDLIDQNRYGTLLEEYFHHFRPEQIFVFYYDELRNSSEAFLAKLAESLGVSIVEFTADSNSKNSRSAPRFKLLTLILRTASDFIKNNHFYKVHSSLKNNKFIRGLVFTNNDLKVVFNEESKKILRAELQPEIAKLSVLLNKDLSSWKI